MVSKKLNMFYLRNSSRVHWNGEGAIPVFDEDGNITNADFSKTTAAGFDLTENDFIEAEREFIRNKIDWDDLPLEKKKIVSAYLNLLETKQEREERRGQMSRRSDNNHPEFDPNLWNYECFQLFKYLFDNYFKGQTNRQL